MDIKESYQIGKCPHCGNRQRDNRTDAFYYGSPVRTCRKCGGQYVDRCYHEVAVEGFRDADVSVEENKKNVRNAALLLVCAAALNVLFYFLERHSWIYLLFVVFGVVYLAVSVMSFCKVKKGARQQELEEARQASIERLSDPEYARCLKDLDYDVPEQYLS